jgi:hypothetical protein
VFAKFVYAPLNIDITSAESALGVVGAAVGVTLNTVVIVPVANPPDAACVAVIVEEPTPTIVIVLPLIVATAVLLLV